MSEYVQGLTLDEAATLLNIDAANSGLMELVYETALAIKNRIYGNRIVLFAPLYIANYCVNSCTYCAFRAANKGLQVRAGAGGGGGSAAAGAPSQHARCCGWRHTRARARVSASSVAPRVRRRHMRARAHTHTHTHTHTHVKHTTHDARASAWRCRTRTSVPRWPRCSGRATAACWC
jgi:hypothetical protein